MKNYSIIYLHNSEQLIFTHPEGRGAQKFYLPTRSVLGEKISPPELCVAPAVRVFFMLPPSVCVWLLFPVGVAAGGALITHRPHLWLILCLLLKSSNHLSFCCQFASKL